VREETDKKHDGGLSAQTLAIASAASVVAAIFTHEIWSGGAIVGAAITPVIVAVVSESLRKPTQRLTAVSSRVTPRPPVRRAPAGRRTEATATRVAERERPPRDDRFGIWEAERPGWRDRLSGKHLKIALATGFLAFAIGAFALTGAELVFGGSVGSTGQKTTIFSGRSGDSSDKTSTQPADTTSSDDQSDQEQEEPVPDAQDAPAETTPAPTTTPAQGEEPVPQQPGAAAAPAEPQPGATPEAQQQPPAAQPTP
jgi:hypothetical protein